MVKTISISTRRKVTLSRSNTLSIGSFLNISNLQGTLFMSFIARVKLFKKTVEQIEQAEGGIDAFSKGYTKMGFNTLPSGEISYKEWAPNAKEAYLIGEFSIFLISISDSLLSRQLESFLTSHGQRLIWSLVDLVEKE